MPDSGAVDNTKDPWFKFFVSNWQGDELLALCSFAARGLLIELICLMHKSARYGYLLVNGSNPTDSELARLVRGVSASEIRRLKAELLDRGVLSTDEGGILYSRRMVRTGQRSARARVTGALGGNPALKKDNQPDNRPVNGQLNQSTNPQKIEDRRQKIEDRSLSTTTTVHPPDARSRRPVFRGVRFVVFEWMVDDLRKLLGKHFEGFGLDEWFQRLDREAGERDELIPQRDGGQWLQARTIEEAQRRGLQVADASTKADPLARSMFAPGTSTAELAEALREGLAQEKAR